MRLTTLSLLVGIAIGAAARAHLADYHASTFFNPYFPFFN